jgi:predicted dehydrogenase
MTGLLVGYGSIGRRHLTNLHSLGVTDWAVVHTGQGTLPLELPGPARMYADLDEALEQERPSFAVIANPTSMHLEAALSCTDAGCGLLIEKPLSHSLDGVDELAAAASARGTKVLVGFQFRFHPALTRIRDLLRSGSMGAPLHVRVIWAEHLPSWHPWEDWRRSYAARADLGGGVHHTICHPFDYLRMLFGEPVNLCATLAHDGPLELSVPEAADVVLCFPDNLGAQVHLDFWCRPPMHRMDVICSDGSIEWNYMTGALQVWRADREGCQVDALPSVRDRNDLFLGEARHFLGVLRGSEQSECSLDDGIAVVRICEAIDRSAASGQMTPIVPVRSPDSTSPMRAGPGNGLAP